VERVHLLTLVVGMAAIDACSEVTGSRPLLKWPNDIVTGEPSRKLAGILGELLVEHGEVSAVVVGMGMNVNWPQDAPADLVGVATSLSRLADRPIDRGAVLVAVLGALDRRYTELSAGHGPELLLDDVRAASATLGKKVRVELPGGKTLVGRAEEITPEGHLGVRDGSGALRVVSAGDVVHLRPA
jgi:BirA family biotin operon repressor/biotin-[acetyl-CoA-carboxylase] ligase